MTAITLRELPYLSQSIGIWYLWCSYNSTMHAELAYLFRHTLHCDAAYELQLPGQRARLHALALRIIESVLAVSAPEPVHDAADDPAYKRNPCDPYAAELAYHAAQSTAVLPYASLKETRRRQACYLMRAAEYAANEYQHHDSARFWQQLSEMPELAPERKAESLRRAAGSLDAAGRFQDALASAQTALKLGRELEQEVRKPLCCAALARAGLAQVHLGLVEEARTSFEEALALARALNDSQRTAQSLRNIANLLMATGEIDQAQRVAREALVFALEAGDARTIAVLHGNIGTMLLEVGKLEEAEPLMRESIRQLHAIHDKPLQAQILGNLGSLYDQKGDAETARVDYQQALELARSGGDRRIEGILLGNLATLLQNAHRNAEAAEGFQAALDLAQEMGDLSEEGLCLGNLGTCDLDLDRFQQAADNFQRALKIAREVREMRLEGVWLCHSASAHTMLGQFATADEEWGAGFKILQEMADPYFLPVLTRQYNRYRIRKGLAPVPEGP